MDAKEYLIDKGIFSKHVLTKDSVLVNVDELITLMEGYAATKPYSPEVARQLLKIKTGLDFLEDEYPDEGIIRDVLSNLRTIADPNNEKNEPDGTWAEMERIAKDK